MQRAPSLLKLGSPHRLLTATVGVMRLMPALNSSTVKYKGIYSSCKIPSSGRESLLNLVISSERIEWHTIYEHCIDAHRML